MQQLSKTINQLLKDTRRRGKYEQIAKEFATKYTWEHTAREIVRLFKQSPEHASVRYQPSPPTLSSPLFCRRYDPRTGTTYPSAYRQETNQYADACTRQDDCGDNEQCNWTCLDWVWVPDEGIWTCRVEGMGCV